MQIVFIREGTAIGGEPAKVIADEFAGCLASGFAPEIGGVCNRTLRRDAWGTLAGPTDGVAGDVDLVAEVAFEGSQEGFGDALDAGLQMGVEGFGLRFEAVVGTEEAEAFGFGASDVLAGPCRY